MFYYLIHLFIVFLYLRYLLFICKLFLFIVLLYYLKVIMSWFSLILYYSSCLCKLLVTYNFFMGLILNLLGLCIIMYIENLCMMTNMWIKEKTFKTQQIARRRQRNACKILLCYLSWLVWYNGLNFLSRYYK